jgi:hypothetical protein
MRFYFWGRKRIARSRVPLKKEIALQPEQKVRSEILFREKTSAVQHLYLLTTFLTELRAG